MTCNGSCCEHFPLPLSLEMIKRKAQNSEPVNGTLQETKMLAEMLTPIKNEATIHSGKRYFYYTCSHFNTVSRKCMIYEKRPSLCRTYPNYSLCSENIKGGCSMAVGTDDFEAQKEFRDAHNLELVRLKATDGKFYDYAKKRRAHRPCPKQH